MAELATARVYTKPGFFDRFRLTKRERRNLAKGLLFISQGLCASGEWANDEGDGLLGTLAGRAQPGGDPMHAGAMEDTHRRIPPQRHHRRPLPDMDATGILAEGDILAPTQPVLDRPMTPFERQ
ncbi:MAG: hypothetical protein ACRDJH_26575 [Thermomicrobiales bacterium]